MKHFLLALVMAVTNISLHAANETAFGWGACSDANGTSYTLDGGWRIANPKVGVIHAIGNNADDKTAIEAAIAYYDIIIFDGSNGDFTVSSSISLSNVSNKTFIGRNNARLCTQWYITDAIRTALINANLSQYSSDESQSTGGIINGETIKEDREYHTRLTLIEATGDDTESYRKAGIFTLAETCENFIIRNITFVGPGSVDIGGNDLITNHGATHVWVDHCDFIDGMDGNLDSGYGANMFVTYSWNYFHYTSRSFSHQLTNLLNSGSNPTQYVTFAYNHWGNDCLQRMPLASGVRMHMYNNYFSCTSSTANIALRGGCDALVENNYFANGVKSCFTDSSGDNYYTVRNNIAFTTGGSQYTLTNSKYGGTHTQASMEVPYTYTDMIAVANVPSVVGNTTTGAGATLSDDYFDVEVTKDFGAKLILNGKNSEFVNGAPTTTSTLQYFSTAGDIQFNSKYNGCTYDDVTYTSGLKLQNGTSISWTSAATATVKIVQSTWSDAAIKLNNTALAVADASTAVTGCRVYTINDVAAGDYTVARVSKESGLFAIYVNYNPVLTANNAASISATQNGVEVTEDVAVSGQYLTGSTLTATFSPAVTGLSVTLDENSIGEDGTISATATLHYTATTNASGTTTLTLSDGTISKEITVTYNADLAVVPYEFNAPKKYALAASSNAIPSNTSVELKDGTELLATLTYGESGGNVFGNPKSDTHVTGYTAFTSGNGTNGNETGGTFYTIVPKYNAVISIAVVLNNGKSFYILEDGTALSDYNGITVTEKYYGTYEFKATANKAYKFYCSGSKLGFYGFEMRPYIKLTLGQNGYSTFAGEHNYTVSGEGQACTGDYNSTSKKVALTACDAGAIIEKGAGIVLRGAQEGDEVTITYTDDNATVASGATGFVGVISTTTGINDNPYVLSSNGTKTAFVKAGAYGTVEALMNMAYLDGSANSINSFLVDFDDKATGVEAIHSQQTATHAYYTIDGRRLSARPTAKGVYIIGNKITVIE